MKLYKRCNCIDIPENTIHKIAAVTVVSGQTLVVKKNGLDKFISLGGKHEGEETYEECLVREANEELGVGVNNPTFLGRFTDLAVPDNIPLVLDAYLVNLDGILKPNNEIEDFLWVAGNYDRENIKLASILEKFIIPELIKRKLI